LISRILKCIQLYNTEGYNLQGCNSVIAKQTILHKVV